MGQIRGLDNQPWKKEDSNCYEIIDDKSISISPYNTCDLPSTSKDMVISIEKKNSSSKGIITQSITPEERKKR